MGSICISSEDEVLESYSLSADVSESESCSSGFSRRRLYSHRPPSSTCLTSSPPSGADFADIFYSQPPNPFTMPPVGGRYVVTEPTNTEEPLSTLSEVALMKERFAKLLLGEDMSGGGKGVCTALAISNAITNLSATVFGELWKLEPLAPQTKAMWCREMDWLLSVSDSIVELMPSVQDFPGGGTLEVMVTRPRSDLYVNLPALKKLDAMLVSILDGFHDPEFYYVERAIILADADADDTETFPLYSCSGRPCTRQEEKWWLPFPKVPPNGLSNNVRKALQHCRDCSNQILKAAMAMNNSVMAEMEIPDAYLESLPKSGKDCLGGIIYRYIAADQFSPECLLDYLDLSSEYTTLEIANRIEAAAHIWKQKYLKRSLTHAKSGKSSWGGKVKGLVSDTEKSKLLAYRADTLLQNLRTRFPGLPQTALDMKKLQYNKDVGRSVLESYSRVTEGLAFNILTRIDDLLYVDDATKQQANAESMCLYEHGRFGGAPPKQKRTSPNLFSHALPAVNPLNHQMARSPGRRTHKPMKQSNLRDALDEKLEKLTF